MTTINIIDGTVRKNTARGDGGGFWANGDAYVEITNGSISNNEITLAGRHGGGFYARLDSDVVLTNVDVKNNVA